MAILKAIDPGEATGPAREQFDMLQRALGRVPTMVRVGANSPVVLETYLHTPSPARQRGVSEGEQHAARRAHASDSKTAETLQFAASIVRRAGRVPPGDVERLRRIGFSDEEIVDIVGAVSLNIFRNYFNLVAGTEIDSPLVRSPQRHPA